MDLELELDKEIEDEDKNINKKVNVDINDFSKVIVENEVKFILNDDMLIIGGLLRNSHYLSKVIPHLKSAYFSDDGSRLLFKIIKTYTNKYKTSPNKPIVEKAVTSLTNKSDEFINEILEKIDIAYKIELPNSYEFMVNETENYCKAKAMEIAINKAITIYDNANSEPHNRDKNLPDSNAIPEIMREALAVSFTSSLGHDYDNNAEDRWLYYNTPENKISFGVDILDKITNNGVLRKTLNVLVAGINVGKTLMLVWLASIYKKLGYNVLYITNEVSEFEISKRVDANLMNIDSALITNLSKEKYFSKIAELKSTTHGKLRVKEYPIGTCSANQIRHHLRELEIKEGFKPDIIINDYITINRADKMQFTGNTGNYFEAVAEEMRSLATEENVVMWTAAQFNSDGLKSNDPELTDIGSSIGIGKVADLAWAVMRNPILDQMGQLFFKQLKTRYHKERYQKWHMGVDIGTQKLFEVDSKFDVVTLEENNKIDKNENESKTNDIFENTNTRGKRRLIV